MQQRFVKQSRIFLTKDPRTLRDLAENIVPAARTMPEGNLLSPKELVHLGSRAAVDKALSRQWCG